MSSGGSGNAGQTEWQEARSIIARFDNNLHDLRKYGFSFITALLAANGLLSVSTSAPVSDGVKAGVLITTLGLIVTLKLLDMHYRLFQRSAAMRARMLEQRLNIDITNDLSFFYGLEKWWTYVQDLYYGFVALTVMIGVAILWGHPLLIILLVVAALVAALLIRTIERTKPTPAGDWSVDNKILSVDTPLRITYTNLVSSDAKAPATFNLSWEIRSMSSPSGDTWKGGAMNVPLQEFGGYDWLWETNGVQPGLYILQMKSVRTPKAGEAAIPGELTGSLAIQVTRASPAAHAAT
jgi:hypothetical protein